MISPTIIAFLKKLQKDNSKAWFDAHRKDYDEAREYFVNGVGQMITEIAKSDSDIAMLKPKDCIFRINRDVRFSKDKRPYKNNMSAYFNQAGKKGNGAGYYMHIEPGKSFVAAGIWMPEAPDLKKIRQEIDYNLSEWKSVISSREFKKYYFTLEQSNVLIRPPKGYDEENPAIDFLKLKSFVVAHSFTDEEISKKSFMNVFSKSINAAVPVTRFLNIALQ